MKVLGVDDVEERVKSDEYEEGEVGLLRLLHGCRDLDGF